MSTEPNQTTTSTNDISVAVNGSIEHENIWTAGGPIALKEVEIKGKITGRIADLSITQKYVNKGKTAKSVVFKFPFPEELGVVTSFSVKTDSKVGMPLKAEVKENKAQVVQDAQNILTASFDSVENTRELLIASVTNLEPSKEISIMVGYIATASVSEADCMRFALPTDLSHSNEEDELPHDLKVQIELDMPVEVKTLPSSPTHSLVVTIDDHNKKKGSLTCIEKDSTQDEDLIVYIPLSMQSTCTYETSFISKTGAATSAVMLNFIPQLKDLKEVHDVEFVFLVDCSVSMSGMILQQARTALELFLKKLPANAYYNIISIGSTEKKLSQTSIAFGSSGDHLKKATEFINQLESDAVEEISLSSTLASLVSTPLPKNAPFRRVVLITCGGIADAYTTMNIARENVATTRIFIIGVGDRTAHHLLSSIAKASCGVVEYIIGKESVEKKVERHLKRIFQAPITDIQLDWGELASKNKQVHISPATLNYLYDGEPLTIYAFLDGTLSSTQEFAVSLKATTPNGVVSFPLAIKKTTCFQTGPQVHKLVAAALIRDAENGTAVLTEEQLTSFSTTYTLTSSSASFIFMEKAEKAEKASSNLLSYRLTPDAEEERGGESSEEENDDPMNRAVSPAPDASSVPDVPKRRQYGPQFLLSFQALCTEKPPNMPSFDLIIGSTTAKSPRAPREGGDKRNKGRSGGGGGGGGGGSHGHGKSEKGRGGRAKKVEPALPPVSPLKQSENRWQRPNRTSSEQQDAELLKCRGFLNKLTKDNFNKIAEKIEKLDVSTQEMLKGVVGLIFDKALGENKFCAMYAELCVQLNKHQYPEAVDDKKTKTTTFRRFLLERCQHEFENKSDVKKEVKKEGEVVVALTPEEFEMKNKLRIIGNIKFIGELYKQGIIAPTIMQECVSKLLATKSETQVPEEENIECLVKLLTTIGSSQDTSKKEFMKKDFMIQTFTKLQELSNNKALASRMRFLILDLLDLRANSWVARRKEAGPSTIAEVHQEAEKEDKKNEAASRNAMKRSVDTIPSISRTTSASLEIVSPRPRSKSPNQNANAKDIQRSVSRDDDDKGWEAVRGGKPTKGGKPREEDKWEAVKGSKGAANTSNSKLIVIRNAPGGKNAPENSRNQLKNSQSGWKNDGPPSRPESSNSNSKGHSRPNSRNSNRRELAASTPNLTIKGSGLVDGYITTESLQSVLMEVIENGKALKMAVEALLRVATRKDAAALKELITTSKLDLLSFVKSANRNPQFLADFLKDKEPLGSIVKV